MEFYLKFKFVGEKTCQINFLKKLKLIWAGFAFFCRIVYWKEKFTKNLLRTKREIVAAGGYVKVKLRIVGTNNAEKNGV